MLQLNLRTLGLVLGACVALFALAGTSVVLLREVWDHGYLHGLAPLLDLDKERNLPQVFTMLLLLLASSITLLLASLTSEPRRVRIGWRIVALAIFAVAIEEVLTFHEASARGLRATLGLEGVAAFHFAWTIPALVLLACAAPLLLGLARSLERHARLLAIAGGTVYLGGALGMEMIDGTYAAKSGQANLTYGLMTTVEEILEMTGIVLYIRAIAEQIARTHQTIGVRFAT